MQTAHVQRTTNKPTTTGICGILIQSKLNKVSLNCNYRRGTKLVIYVRSVRVKGSRRWRILQPEIIDMPNVLETRMGGVEV